MPVRQGRLVPAPGPWPPTRQGGNIQSKTVSTAPTKPGMGLPGGGKELAGFLLSGFLLALLGAILPAWGYHRDPPDFVAVGNYFLCLAIGIVAATPIARPIMAKRGLSFLLVFACGLSCLSLLYLAAVSPPTSEWWQVGGLLSLGTAAGLLNMGLFYAVS